MKCGRFAAGASLLPLGLLLAACGGGGVNSTPTPGTPTPTPGQSTNDDLFAPLVSEAFTNSAAEIGGDYQADGNIENQYARRASLTFSYDASKATYTVSAGGVSQQFGASDIDDQDSSSVLYLRENGDRTDTLLLTKPGTSGVLTYRYVGAGFWQRTDEHSTSADIDIRAFTYGVETPSSAVPKSGKASYDIDVLALSGYEQYVGRGAAAVDFGSGKLLYSAPLQTVLLDGTISNDGVVFSGSGALGSGNSFSGSFSIPQGLNATGTVEGMFYGPAADEIGAAFYGSGIAGTIVGRKGSGSALADASGTIVNQGLYSSYSYELVDGPGTALSRSNFGFNFNTLTYNGSTKTYSLDSPAWAESFGPSSKVSGDTRFDVYQRADGTKLSVFKASPSNPDIALSYLSFAVFEMAPEPKDGATGYQYVYKDWGLRTEVRPESGSATYAGLIYGVGTGNTRIYDLSGKASFTMNFGSANWTGSFAPTGTLRGSGQSYTFASLATHGTISNGNEFQGMDSGTVLQIYGYFYGPAANELGATFSGGIGMDPAGSGEGIAGAGVIVAAMK